MLFAWGGSNDLHAATAIEKPNVVLIFTDDQGTIDVNCYGSKDLYTPNLDKLARRGVRFTQFYVGAPVCSPSRAALLTGRYPQRAGLTSNAGGNRGLPPQQFTIAEMLKENGYRTALFGKWHLGEAPQMSPISQGFDQFFGHKKGCIDNYSHFFYWSGPNVHDLWKNDTVHWEDGKYFPDMVVREAVRFLEENKNHPFFLFLPFNIPHYPLQGQKKYRQMVSHLAEPRKSYAALVSTLDEKIGLVIDKIDQLGLRENTIIIFLSDHGHSVEVRTNSGGGSAGPYRGHKFTLWEGGIRVPCIISWPGQIPQNQVRDQI
ncbi:MAG: sulfatase-like hydrolase/transferase, partial [Planctomycetes bacterium]|nr:sulfatase-like hydrolase/transferase [Planctomycetota bacterium]